MRIFLVFILMVISLSMQAQNSSLRLARQYYQQQEYEKALSYLKPYIKDNQRNAYAIALNSLLALKEYKKAERLISSYINSSGGNFYDYYVDLYALYLEQKDEDEAEDVLENIFKRVKQNPGLSYGFAKSYSDAGYPQVALDLYLIAEAKIPNANYAYQKALLYGELGDIKNMYRSYVDMLKDRPAYLSTVKQLLGRSLNVDVGAENIDFLKELLVKEIQSGGPEILNELLVFVFVKEENFSGAFTQLKALDKRKGGNKGQLFNLGSVAMNNGDYLTARRIFTYIIKAGDEYPFYEAALALNLKSEKLRLLENPATSAEQWLSLQDDHFEALKKLQNSPEKAPLTIELSDISAFQLEQTDTATALLKNLIGSAFISKEDVARAKIKLADILLYAGNRWDAIIFYKQAEKAFEQSPIGQEAKFKRAKAAYYVGDFQWAKGIFDALKTSTSKKIANDALYYSILITDNTALDTTMEAMAMFAKADLMDYQNRQDSALQILNQMEIAFLDHPINDEVLFLKANIFSQRRDFSQAEVALRQIIDEHNKDILADDALYQLALIYEQELNNPDEASKLYELIFTEHTDSFYTSEARKRFRKLRGDILN